jgi:hypothetical protein
MLQVTFDWHDMIDRISIKTGAKLSNTNFTIFVFAAETGNGNGMNFIYLCILII